MIVLRNTASAFLMYGDDFLLMKRAETREIAPGLWAGVGGHLEPDEINQPEKACLREIFEETGMRESQIEGLTLKYMLLRRSKDEIRVNAIYFGNTTTREFVDTEEGKLHWVAKGELFNREFSPAMRMMLVHYIKLGYKLNDVIVGTVRNENNQPFMSWGLLQDWEPT